MNEQEATKDIYKQVREEIRNEYEVRITELEEECRELALQRDRLAVLLRKGKRSMSAEQLHEWQMQTDDVLAELETNK